MSARRPYPVPRITSGAIQNTEPRTDCGLGTVRGRQLGKWVVNCMLQAAGYIRDQFEEAKGAQVQCECYRQGV